MDARAQSTQVMGKVQISICKQIASQTANASDTTETLQILIASTSNQKQTPRHAHTHATQPQSKSGANQRADRNAASTTRTEQGETHQQRQTQNTARHSKGDAKLVRNFGEAGDVTPHRAQGGREKRNKREKKTKTRKIKRKKKSRTGRFYLRTLYTRTGRYGICIAT